jgi:hypothetical protein
MLLESSIDQSMQNIYLAICRVTTIKMREIHLMHPSVPSVTAVYFNKHNLRGGDLSVMQDRVHLSMMHAQPQRSEAGGGGGVFMLTEEVDTGAAMIPSPIGIPSTP